MTVLVVFIVFKMRAEQYLRTLRHQQNRVEFFAWWVRRGRHGLVSAAQSWPAEPGATLSLLLIVSNRGGSVGGS